MKRLTPTIVEVIVKAPAAARRFRPGQFYRLQNYAALAPLAGETRLQMEGLALTGAWVDRERGLVSTIVLEMGGSSNLCAMLAARRAGRADGSDRQPDAHRRQRDRDPRRRRARQRGAVLDRPGVPRGGLAGALLRRLQEEDRPLQGRRHRGGGRRHRLVLRRGARLRAGAAAGLRLRRQHRAGDGSVRVGPPRRAADPAVRRRPHHRDRLGPDDGGGRAGAPRRARAVPEAASLRDRLDQLADAVHDEGDLRAVPAAAARSARPAR